MSAVPLADVKKHLQMSGSNTSNDAELQTFIDAAETAIGHRVGPLTPVSTVEKHPGGQRMLVLRQPQAVSLTSIGYADGSTGTLSDFDLDPQTGVLYATGTLGCFPAGHTGATDRYVTVTYLAGWSEVPPDLVQAVKELTRHLWETQRGASTGARPGFTDTQDVQAAGDRGSWPPRVEQLVAPYSVPKIA